MQGRLLTLILLYVFKINKLLLKLMKYVSEDAPSIKYLKLREYSIKINTFLTFEAAGYPVKFQLQKSSYSHVLIKMMLIMQGRLLTLILLYVFKINKLLLKLMKYVSEDAPSIKYLKLREYSIKINTFLTFEAAGYPVKFQLQKSSYSHVLICNLLSDFAVYLSKCL